MRQSLVALASMVALIPAWLPAQSSEVAADYARATGLADRVRNTVVDVVAEGPVWVEGGTQFWYRKSVAGGSAFVWGDAATGTKGPAFDHARLASSIGTAAGGTYTATTLPFTTPTFAAGRQSIEFTVGAHGGRCRRTRCGGRGSRGRTGARPRRCSRPTSLRFDHLCLRAGRRTRRWRLARPVRDAAAPDAAARLDRRPRRDRGAGRAHLPRRALRRLHPELQRVHQDRGRAARRRARRSAGTASEGQPYTFNSLTWSPDAARLAAYRRRPGFNRLVSYVQSSPPDQVQPKFSSARIASPATTSTSISRCSSTWPRSGRPSSTARSFRTRTRPCASNGAATAAPSRSSTTSAVTRSIASSKWTRPRAGPGRSIDETSERSSTIGGRRPA